MRRTPAALTAFSLVALSLAGCASSSPAAGCERAGEESLSKLVEVSGSSDSKPEVQIHPPVKDSGYFDVKRGDGEVITDKDQPVLIDFQLYDGGTGEELGVGTPYNGEYAMSTSLVELLPGIGDALKCATEGSRITVGLGTPDAQTRERTRLPETPLVAVVDVRTVYPAHAEGDPQYNDSLGMPTVVRSPDGRPGVIVPNATAPSEQVTQTLIKGRGDEITKKDALVVHYTTVSWDTRSVSQSSWEDGMPAVIMDGQLLDGSGATLPGADALIGQTIGSQVMMVVPGEGEGSSATVVVVDILGKFEIPDSASSQ